MSERKTAEVKVRCTPTEKAEWQAEADRRDTSVSEIIRERMNVTMLDPDDSQFQTILAAPSGGDGKAIDVAAVCEHGVKTWAYCGRCFEAEVTR